MSAGMEQIRAQMAEHLNSHGVVAVTAWPDSGRTEEGRVVAVVSLRGCQVGPAGFQNYLGERYDQETGLWQERYGRRARLTFGLDLYAPKQGSGQAGRRGWRWRSSPVGRRATTRRAGG